MPMALLPPGPPLATAASAAAEAEGAGGNRDSDSDGSSSSMQQEQQQEGEEALRREVATLRGLLEQQVHGREMNELVGNGEGSVNGWMDC